ncbi:PEP-CTERM sorting domain-containing protein [Rhodoferax sp.]|uniref:PEP-CTERM sorting domain-containing protein n=1 Tax=Rhodoferax sp. TaxID=50421 RepID=UPI0025D19D18|nr:PEP-CTERM sorting domain-containing protein [Rhodoferax sp.]
MRTTIKFIAGALLLGGLMAGQAFATAAPTFSIVDTSKTKTINLSATSSSDRFDVAIPTNFSLSGVKTGSFLSLSSAASLAFTFVGEEAGYNNVFGAIKFKPLDVGLFSNNASTPGATSFTFSNVAAGQLNFGFLSNAMASMFYGNGSTSIGLKLSADKQSALLMFNDSYKRDRDYDDMVVKVSILTAVPEPETYALMLGGLALLGAVARRNRKQA